MRNISKFSLFISLYLVQTIPTAFIKTGFQSILNNQNFGLKQISGFMGMMLLPWVLKFLWAPLVDRKVSGSFVKNKYFILIFQAIGALILLYISTLSIETDIKLIIYLFLFFNIISATQDIAIDGLAIRIFRRKDYGKANSIQTGGYYAGEVIGGAFILIILGIYGWKMSMIAFALFYLIPFFPVLLAKPDIRIERKTFGVSDVNFSVLKTFFKLPSMKFWVIIILFFTINRVLSSTLLLSLLKDLNGSFFTDEKVASWIGIYGNVFGLIGAVLGGILMPKLGSRKSLISYSYFKIIGIFLMIGFLLLPFSPNYIFFVICFNDFFGGLAAVALFSVMMEKCRLESAGSDFTLQASIHSIAVLIAVFASGNLVDLGALYFENGYMLTMISSIILGFITILMLYKFDFTATKKNYKKMEMAELEY